MSDTWQPPTQPTGHHAALDAAVQDLQNSMARPIAEVTKLINELRTAQHGLWDQLVFKGDVSVGGSIETTARANTDKGLLTGLLLILQPSTVSASVQIGELLFPVQSTTFQLATLARVLNPQDRIKVNLQPDGPVTLYMWGKVIPVASI